MMQQIHIWLGTCDDEASLDAFFEEDYDDDDAPINQFAASQGVTDYDPDWVERGFKPGGSLRELISPHSYAEVYLEDALAHAAGAGLTSANTFILADVELFAAPASVDQGEISLTYLGQFTCKP